MSKFLPKNCSVSAEGLFDLKGGNRNYCNLSGTAESFSVSKFYFETVFLFVCFFN